MSEFSWVPDFGAEVSDEIRVRSAKFGEGYEQRAPDGLNPLKQTFRYDFTRRDELIDQMVTFLRARATGQSFTFTPHSGDEIRVLCFKWSRTYKDFGVSTLSLEMERTYEGTT